LVEIENVGNDILQSFHLGLIGYKALKAILYIWFYGLRELGVNLEKTEISYTYFEDTFSYSLYHIFGMKILREGKGFFCLA
jgi:hypothetical protein